MHQGMEVGRYVVGFKLGQGSVGEVWQARHAQLNRNSAVKFLRADCRNRKATRQRFLAEAKALAAITCAHVVTVFDYDETPDGAPYIVLELLEGRTLRQLLGESGRLSEGQALKLLGDACRGTASAHRAGLVHRDLKPENLFVADVGSGHLRCKVLDFGVVKDNQSENLTLEGALIGTVRYMSPEQVRGEHLDTRSDIYALGAILFEVLTGSPLIEGANDPVRLFKILNTLHDDERRWIAVSPDIAAIIKRATAPRPGDRFQSAEELLLALDVALAKRSEEATEPDAGTAELRLPADQLLQRPSKAPKRRVTALVGAALTAVATTALVASLSRVDSGSSPETSKDVTQTAPSVSTPPTTREPTPVSSSIAQTTSALLAAPAPVLAPANPNNAKRLLAAGAPTPKPAKAFTPHPAPADATAAFSEEATSPQPPPARPAGAFILRNPYAIEKANGK